MTIFIATFIILVIAVVAMAVGVIVSNRRIEGSCGGLASLGIDKACDCDRPCARRRKMEAVRRGNFDIER